MKCAHVFILFLINHLGAGVMLVYDAVFSVKYAQVFYRLFMFIVDSCGFVTHVLGDWGNHCPTISEVKLKFL